MQKPFFSIIIPTRNRPALFRDALWSVLLQDFDDFEIVVSDNSSNDETRAVIETFPQSDHLRYFRPDSELLMPEHWEFATTKARGLYVLVLTDRSVLKRHALKAIHQAICAEKQPVSVCSWRWSLFDDLGKVEYADIPIVRDGAVSRLVSRDVAQSFAIGERRYPYALPRALNSCYRNEVADMIRSKHGVLFMHISPDFTSAFLLLAHVEHVLFMDSALFISQGLSDSGGGRAYTTTSASEYMKSLAPRDYYAHVPIKAPLVENLVFADFLAVREMADGNLREIELGWAHYFVTCYQEVIQKKALTAASRREIKAIFLEWEHALAKSDFATRQKVKRAVAGLLIVKLKIFLKRLPFWGFLLKLKFRLTVSNQNRRTVLELAGFPTQTKEGS